MSPQQSLCLTQYSPSSSQPPKMSRRASSDTSVGRGGRGRMVRDASSVMVSAKTVAVEETRGWGGYHPQLVGFRHVLEPSEATQLRSAPSSQQSLSFSHDSWWPWHPPKTDDMSVGESERGRAGRGLRVMLGSGRNEGMAQGGVVGASCRSRQVSRRAARQENAYYRQAMPPLGVTVTQESPGQQSSSFEQPPPHPPRTSRRASAPSERERAGRSRRVSDASSVMATGQ